jgi:hypothetical protein
MKLTAVRLTPVLTGLALALQLAACGGSDAEDDAADFGTTMAVAPAGAATLAQGRAWPLADHTVTPPLLDDLGRPTAALPQAVPADLAARTRSRHYATAAQAAMLEDRFGVLAIPVNVEPGPDATLAVELATLMVFGHQAVHDLSPDAPVLVRGPDLRLAAAAVHQLEVIGFTRVFLVTR